MPLNANKPTSHSTGDTFHLYSEVEMLYQLLLVSVIAVVAVYRSLSNRTRERAVFNRSLPTSLRQSR